MYTVFKIATIVNDLWCLVSLKEGDGGYYIVQIPKYFGRKTQFQIDFFPIN